MTEFSYALLLHWQKANSTISLAQMNQIFKKM